MILYNSRLFHAEPKLVVNEILRFFTSDFVRAALQAVSSMDREGGGGAISLRSEPQHEHFHTISIQVAATIVCLGNSRVQKPSSFHF